MTKEKQKLVNCSSLNAGSSQKEVPPTEKPKGGVEKVRREISKSGKYHKRTAANQNSI